MKKVAVVLLNWNGSELLKKFIPPILRHTPKDLATIYVADNGSSDDSLTVLKNFPEIEPIILDKNYGFAGGYNRAIDQINEKYVLLLNTDVEVTENWLEPLVNILDNYEDVASVQPKIKAYHNKELFEYAGACGGFIDYYGYPFCRGRILGCIEKDEGQYESSKELFWTTGAAMLMRTQLYKDCGGLDEDFFAHQEEIDLCWRMRARSYRLVCEPKSIVFHMGGATLNAENPHKTFLNFRNNLLMIYKNMPQKYLRKVMTIRFFLDYLACFNFLAHFRPANAFAVIKARMEFHKRKKNLVPIRNENITKTIVNNIPEVYQHSMVWDFYFKKKKKFSDLKF